MFKSWQDVQEYLGKKTDRPYTHGRATRVQKRENGIAIKYHDTDVVLFTPDYIELNSGGWRTLTTKARMNENIPNTVIWQDRGVWYVNPVGHWGRENRITYFDGIRLSYDGEILNPRAEDAEELRVKVLTKQINEYAKNFVAKLEAGEIDMPSGADCWFCYMTADNNKSMGDSLGDHDHLLEHISEGYYVPTLLLRAVNEHGSLAGYEWVHAHLFHGASSWDGFGRFGDDARKCLVSYLKLRLAVGR